MAGDIDELKAKIAELTGKLSEHSALSSKITEQSGELKVLTGAIGTMVTEFRDFKNGIGPRLERHGEDIRGLQTDRKNDIQYLGAVDKKVDEHVKGHWQWVVVMVSVLALSGYLYSFITSHNNVAPSQKGDPR